MAAIRPSVLTMSPGAWPMGPISVEAHRNATFSRPSRIVAFRGVRYRSLTTPSQLGADDGRLQRGERAAEHRNDHDLLPEPAADQVARERQDVGPRRGTTCCATV